MSSSSPILIETVAATKEPKQKAAIIDDAFDDVEEGEIKIKQYLEFYQLVNQEGEFDDLVSKIGLILPEVYIDEPAPANFLDFLQELWRERASHARLKELVDKNLFTEKVDKLNELETICKNLENQNLDVKRINSRVEDPSIFSSGEFVYIFIDYNLGIEPGPLAVANAKTKAREIYNTCPKGKKPVTILMSSESGFIKLIDRFQDEAGMIEGVFRFSPKDQLSDQNKVSLLIRAYSEEFESNHALQDYIHALISAAKGALNEFEKEVQMLRIEDYVFIQNSALRDQAQPLGDYLAWLYGTHWANLLLRNTDLKVQQSIIDKVFSDKPPLHHRLPSSKVSAIYMSALFEEGLGPIELHPLEGSTNSKLAKLPYLHLGDLFTKSETTDVWMVLNAQCDLERPEAKNAERSIFLVRGTLVPFEKPLALSDQKTDFFLFEGVQYQIKWNVKQVDTVPHNKFIEWQKILELERHFRLRLPFALEIQQAFSASISRIGLPVSPPFTQEIRLEVLYRKEDSSAGIFLEESVEYAFLPITRVGDKTVRLTLHFALDFKEALLSKQRELILKKAEVEGGRLANYDKKLFSNINLLLDEFDNWFFSKKGFLYPSGNKPIVLLPPSSLGLSLDSPKDVFVGQNAFIINIVTDDSPSISPTSNPPINHEN
ncbi:hypothetical protein [Spirosoma radiotolerans]|uniref:Uncharacterized protein n=1 Tax=Spirosoma radiotolerans TaxID=1379870 RepID=A0A0E3ZYR5_9BACT|nr:hypothetical protein [Spirosoma radiotolerans]AKD56965.1 hypothetical protein SD10_20715 [Spirosoma radiotolerans]